MQISRISRIFSLEFWLLTCLLFEVSTSFTSSHGSRPNRHSTAALRAHTYTPWANTAESAKFEKQRARIQEQVRRLQQRQQEQLLELQKQKEHKVVAKRKAKQTIRTLYDVLGAPRNATRAELKQCYALLARQTHPDAMVGKDAVTSQGDVFAEVASAWRTLSNTKSRQQYDRHLRAQEFAVEVENMVTEMGKRTMPLAMHAIEKWAVPTFLKTATTTMASASAAADELRNTGDLGSAFVSAIKAGRRAVRAVDQHLLQAAKDQTPPKTAEQFGSMKPV